MRWKGGYGVLASHMQQHQPHISTGHHLGWIAERGREAVALEDGLEEAAPGSAWVGDHGASTTPQNLDAAPR